MADIFNWYDDLLQSRYQPQTSPIQPAPPEQPQMARWQDGQLQPYQPSNANTQEAYNQAWGMTGIPDIKQAYQAYQRGEYLPAFGQGVTGAASLAANVAPAIGAAARAAPAIGRAAAPAVREALPMLQSLLSDESGALRIPRGKAAPPAPELPAYDFNTGRYPGAKFPQYAEEYPPTAPPVEKLKEKQAVEGGTETYLSRELTPEATAFMKERARVQKEMDTHGYEPYYKPEERYYVDPSNYPPRNVTTSTLQPATFETIKKYMGPLDAPETLANLRNAYDKGLTLGDPAHWYAMGQYEADFIKELGPEAGRRAFLDRFAVPMAATTSGNDPTANLMTGHYLEYLRQTGRPMPGHGSEFPAPMYGQRMTSNLEDYKRMRAGEATGEPSGYAALGANQPKMHNFTRSFIGDLEQPVMDDQMARGMLAHRPDLANAARTSAFGLLQQPLVREAYEMGIAPGNLQDVAWAGFRGKPGARPMIGDVNASIERQHRLTGMPREEIVRRAHILKEIPMYGGLGVAGLGGLYNPYGD